MGSLERPFTCQRDGLTIRGRAYFPEGFASDRKYPVVIVSHGFMGNYKSVENYCRDFAGIGYVAFGFGFCGGGCTEEDGIKSDGDTTDMTITTEVADLLAVKEYVMSQAYADRGRLVLAGVSQGGFVSGLAAARWGGEVEKLIMIYPALCIPDHARRGCLGGFAKYDPQNVPERIDCGRTVLGEKFHRDVANMDPYLELSPYQGKVLILHGLEDEIVSYSYSVRAKACYGNGQCSLQLIRNMGHGCDETGRKSIFASIRQFLADRMEVFT